MEDAVAPSRPSFADFWKKSKSTLGVGKIRFVESKPGQGADSGDAQDAAPDKPMDKAQARRAQVRKAQTQHRQRKANYTKQLEMDVARIRDMIEAAERETKDLLKENGAMRAQIQQAVDSKSMPLSLDQGVSLVKEMPSPAELSVGTEKCLQDLENVTVTLGFDEVINAPTFYISSPPPSKSPSAYQPSPPSESTPDSLPDLTPAQTHAAINFILALEHLCRWHFHPSLYNPPPSPSPSPSPSPPGDTAVDTAVNTTVPPVVHQRTSPLLQLLPQASGHTFMATSLALRHAPPNIFRAALRSTAAARLVPGAGVALKPVCSGSNSNSLVAGGVSSSSPATEENADPDPDLDPLSWRTSALTLRSLHGLAASLSPDDALELTPVQAWFELLQRFGAERLMVEGVLDQLKRELVRVVRCPRYGAGMERGAFESVVSRVLDGG